MKINTHQMKTAEVKKRRKLSDIEEEKLNEEKNRARKNWKLAKYYNSEVLKKCSKWIFPFMMISFVGLLETWVFESISGDWSTIISKTITFSTFNLGFFLGMTLIMSLVISRQKHKGIHRESRLYGISFILSFTYIIVVFPALFTNSMDALQFVSGNDYPFKPHEIEFFQMYSISWIIEISSITWFLIMVVRGDWKGVTISRGLAIVVKIITYLCLIYAFSEYKDERLILTMAYSSIALRIMEYICYLMWASITHIDAFKEMHRFFLIPKKDIKRLCKASLLLFNPVIYNFALFLSWRFVFELSTGYAPILAIILPLFKMILYGSSGLAHSIPDLIMTRMAKKEYDKVYDYGVSLKKAAWLIGIVIGIIMFLPLLILGATQTFRAPGLDPTFYYSSLLTIGGFYCILCPLIIQTDVLSTIMLSSGKTRGHTFLNVTLPLLSIIILGFISVYAGELKSIWWIIGFILIVNIKSLYGVGFNSWKFKRKKWLQRLK